jgi:predicted site-specific integrase-resolvase
MVTEVFIMHKYRSCGFVFHLLEHRFQNFHTKLMVHSEEKDNKWKSTEKELNQVLLVIINVFD